MVIWIDNALSHITEFIDEAKEDTYKIRLRKSIKKFKKRYTINI